jgi:pyruvate ferredoxin oxidoreductase alpha subunit
MLMRREALTGNQAVAMAVMYSDVKFVAAYPITPQTSIVEKISYFVEKGLMKAKFVNVESEHSALAMTYGAALGGVRSFTATSSQGLLYMHEWVHWASRSRVPLVMAVVTRTVGPPWNIWPDHSDYMDQRDAGWIMLFAMDAQEAFDMTVQAFRISEDERVFLPVMVGLEGFIVGGTTMSVALPDEESVKEWVGERRQPFVFDGSANITLGNLASPEDTYILHRNIHEDLLRSIEVVKEIEKVYSETFGLPYIGPVETVGEKESSYAVISMGAWSGDLAEAIKQLGRNDVSLYRIRVYRPFPCKELRQALSRKNGIVVFDRSISFGSFGPLYMDVKACLDSEYTNIVNVIGGLGGVDHSLGEYVSVLRKIFGEMDREEKLEKQIWMEVSR